MEVRMRIDLGAVGLLIFSSRRGSISLGSGIWRREGGGECEGVMSKGERVNSVSERGRVKELWVCWGTEVLLGVWLGKLMGVVFKEGVTGIGLRGGCWQTCREFCEEEIISVETEEEVWEVESVESDKRQWSCWINFTEIRLLLKRIKWFKCRNLKKFRLGNWGLRLETGTSSRNWKRVIKWRTSTKRLDGSTNEDRFRCCWIINIFE